MLIRPWTEFVSNLPDDGIEDETGFLQLPGKNVAEAMHEILERLGCEMESVEDAGDHGWEFCFSFKKRRLWCQVTDIGKYLAVVEQNSMFSRMFKRVHPAYLEILAKFAVEMARDPRFSEVRWYACGEFHTDAPGSDSPVPAAA